MNYVKDMNKTKILHITPHLGGGVGSVLLNYLSFVHEDKSFVHSVATLDYANENSVKTSEKIGFELFSNMHNEIENILKLIEDADIVLIHFWNHPLLYDFLVRNELPKSRMLFWAHVSGFTPPYVLPVKALNYPDLFVFTTPLSFDSKEVQSLDDKSNLRIIWSTGGVEHVKQIESKVHNGFNVGYIGTVDYSKMSPDFLEICSKIDIPNVKFIVCGGAKHLELQKQAREMGIFEKFEFTGQVKDISKYLEQFDVFGYPLNPNHYGTCDQVLQEAMAAGVVPVVLNNPMESYIVKNGEVGLVAKNTQEYIHAIETLYYNKKLRIELSQNSKQYAASKYSLEVLDKEWKILFDEVIKRPKSPKKWQISKGNISSMDVFLESLGQYSEVFMIQSDKNINKLKEFSKMPNWQSDTKGTVHQYFDFFSEDKSLEELSRFIKNNQ